MYTVEVNGVTYELEDNQELVIEEEECEEEECSCLYDYKGGSRFMINPNVVCKVCLKAWEDECGGW